MSNLANLSRDEFEAEMDNFPKDLAHKFREMTWQPPVDKKVKQEVDAVFNLFQNKTIRKMIKNESHGAL